MLERETPKMSDSSDLELEEHEEFEDENELLKKLYHRPQSDEVDSEDDVMGFNNDKDGTDSDFENEKEDFQLPNAKAWGRQAKSYYSTDYVDTDYFSVSQKDTANAELEENEAINLQNFSVKQLDEADFGLDLLESKPTDINEDQKEHVKVDLSKLSKVQKQEIFDKTNPEFSPLLSDFYGRLTEIQNELNPYLNSSDKRYIQNDQHINFIKTKIRLLLFYCSNISFYLILKSEKKNVSFHPVVRQLARYRQLILDLEQFEDNFVHKENEFQSIENTNPPNNVGDSRKTNKKLPKTSIQGNDKSLMKYSSNEEVEALVPDSDFNNAKEKRGISYQIAKNKGLMPVRKREQRNPRVKHRNKYRKAMINRKGAIRQVKKETSRYGGESSGIKAGVKKSIKLS